MDSLKAELHTFIDDPMDPVNNYNMGVKYFSGRQYAAAFSHFMRASERSDDLRFAARSLLYASKSMGWQQGRDSKELDLIAHALSFGYKYPEVHCIKAMYHSWRKDWTQCYATCCMALELIDTYEIDEPFLDYVGKETILNQKALAEYNRARYNDSRATYNSILEMNISDCLRNHIQNKLKEFPEPYSKPITWDYNHSQIFQDVFVETVMNKKKNGTYLEIGAGDYKTGNNTLMLEEKYGWKGVSLDFNKDLVYKFNMNRVNKCICADATKVDYTEILKDLPSTIDYLQLDCDPPGVTFEILQRIPFDTHQFNVITYEHDYYNDPTKSFRQKSRDYLTSKGYILAVGDVTADREEQMNFEDWWIHPRVTAGCPRIHTQGPICGERYFKLINSGPEVDNSIDHRLPASIIIDNFYEDPDEVREYALGLEYQPEENHGAVGFRSEMGRRILPGTRELFEKYLGRKIKNWDVHRTNGCFQWCPETTRIVYHCDQTTYAAIIFLTPDAPLEAGLSLCRHKKYKIMDSSIFEKPDWYSPSRNHKEPHTDKTPWERVDKIGNVYNRLVLFNAKYVHAVSEYFGDQINNSRLFQLFFFDV